MYGIILDTEGYSNCPSYNIGYTIADLKKLEIVRRENIAILPNVWYNMEEFNKHRFSENQKNQELSQMYHRNLKDIMLNSGTNKKYHIINSEHGLFIHFARIFKEFDIKDFYAFNMPFDRGALKRTLTEYHYNTLFEKRLMNYHDIQTAVFYTLCNNIEYIKYCIVNGFQTEKGNYQTKAETFYRFLTNNRDFEEEHTALADAEIETEMLFMALKKDPNPSTAPTRPYLELNKIVHKDDGDAICNILDEYLFAA